MLAETKYFLKIFPHSFNKPYFLESKNFIYITFGYWNFKNCEREVVKLYTANMTLRSAAVQQSSNACQIQVTVWVAMQCDLELMSIRWLDWYVWYLSEVKRAIS